jgi:hypothetical protein
MQDGHGRTSRYQSIQEIKQWFERGERHLFMSKRSKTYKNCIEMFENNIETYQNCVKILKNCMGIFKNFQVVCNW